MEKSQSGEMVMYLNVNTVKWIIPAEIIASVNFYFTSTIYQQDNLDGLLKTSVLNNSRLSVGITDNSSYIIQDSE